MQASPPLSINRQEKKRNSGSLSLQPKRGMLKLARNSCYRSEGQTLSTNDIRVHLIELERLLFAMNRQSEQGHDESWHSLQARMDRCFSLWHSIESIHVEEANNPLALKLSEERYENLQNRVFEVCAKFSSAIAERKDRDSSDDLIHRVFIARTLRQAISIDLKRGSSSPDSVSVASSETDSVGPLREKFSEEPVSNHRPSRHAAETAAVAAPSVEDLQRRQREQMEEAISHLASQLKAETARINETLRGQTDHVLEKLEDTATENVQQVTKVAKDVEEHVRSSWNRTFGTWTMLFTMVAAFFFVIVIIQMAPKGKGCVFLCPEQPHPDEFCRTLPNGKMECIRMDKGEKDSKAMTTEETHDPMSTKDKRHAKARRETCEMNEYGECVDTPKEDSRAAMAFEQDDTRKNREKKEKLVVSAMEDSMFDGSGMILDSTVSTGRRPILNRKYFSPRDIRNAANLGDFYLMEDYLTVKPEWVNKVDKNGWGAIHLSARRGDLRAIHFLKRIGADLTIRTVDGRTARDIALPIYEEEHPVIKALTA